MRSDLDLAKLLVGEKLGEGLSRITHALRYPFHDYVLKEQKEGELRQNFMEWEMWDAAPKAAREWLAPCFAVSDCGRYLIQARVMPADPSKIPDKVPAFLGDFALCNFGVYKGRFVACDYGNRLNLFAHNTMMSKKMIKPKWYAQS